MKCQEFSSGSVSLCVFLCACVCVLIDWLIGRLVCCRELVKLFCTESSHRKELMPFLSNLIILLDVSDTRWLQKSTSQPQLSVSLPFCPISRAHTLTPLPLQICLQLAPIFTWELNITWQSIVEYPESFLYTEAILGIQRQWVPLLLFLLLIFLLSLF